LLTILEINPPPHLPHYHWNPAILANVSNSASYLTRALRAQIETTAKYSYEEKKDYINKEFIEKGLGIFDATQEELELFLENPNLSVYYFAEMVSQRAQIGWSTHGHSAVDVNIYGSAGSEALRGNHENIDIGKFLQNYLDVDVDTITRELNKKSESFSTGNWQNWMGSIPTKDTLEALSEQHLHFSAMEQTR
jgi:alkaline phosphatase